MVWFFASIIIIILLILLYVLIMNHVNFYKKEPCSICDQNTGIKGNKRFVLRSGCICENCLKRAGYTEIEIKQMASRALSSKTIDDMQEEIFLCKKMGREQYQEMKKVETAKKIEEFKAQRDAAFRENAEAPLRCPKCGSTQISADKKGFGVGKAVVGAAVAGPIGLAAGNIGARKVRITCLKCGHQWMAGKD